MTGGKALFFHPEQITHVDDLDRAFPIRKDDPAVGACCESIAAHYPGTRSVDVRSSSGALYIETRCDEGFVYHQFYQWACRIGPWTWERLSGFLPIYSSEKQLGGIRPRARRKR